MHAMAHIPTLREIMHQAPQIDVLTPVKEVMELFQQREDLVALPVNEAGTFLNVINRRELFSKHLCRPFAIDLFAKRPIRELLDHKLLALGAEQDIHAALTELLAFDPGLGADSFPVVSDQQCLGIVTVSDLMMKISQNQSLLLETLQQLSARIGEEVAKASFIQRDLLPPAEFRFGPVEISAELVTSSEIGGDFYDYFAIDESRIGLVIADVSGHGVQAGMVTTAAKASLHCLVAQGITTPGEILFGMNNAILATARQALLMTCLMVVIDYREARLTLANAGHNFPYLCRGGNKESQRIEEVAGYPLGFEQNCRYREFTVDFRPGDLLLLYTDGIVECLDRAGEEFGYERLEKILALARGLTPADLRRLLRKSAEAFVGTGVFDDDVTILIAAHGGESSRRDRE